MKRAVRILRRAQVDLIEIRNYVERDRPPGFVLYEVKGPGDQLRPEQRRWLDYLDAGGLPTAASVLDDMVAIANRERPPRARRESAATRW